MFPEYDVQAIVATAPAQKSTRPVEIPDGESNDHYDMIDASGSSRPQEGGEQARESRM